MNPETRVAVVIDIPGGNSQYYERVIAGVFPGDRLPESILLHMAGPTPNGWRIVNVVSSQAEFEKFARERLGAALQQAGEGDVTPRLAFFPIHKVIGAFS